MFTELLPIVRNRKVTIIIKHDADDTLTVNVVPIQLRADENPALCTPLSDVGVTGTAAELDRDFPQALTGYVAQHLTLAQALNQSAAEMEAAKKSAADAAKQASKDASEKWKKTKSGGPQAPAKPTPAAPPAPPSLFDAAPTESTPGAPGLFNTSQLETASATSTAADSEPESSEDEEDSDTEGDEEEELACAV